MSTLSAQLNDNRILICDTILRSIAEELDIPPSKYKEAVERYTSVGNWLEAGVYPGTVGEPSIYVQGSFRLGTVVRPFRKGRDVDYDIDLACELGSSTQSSSSKSIKHMVGNRLKEHGTYREMLEPEGRRCWTLIYAEQDGVGFHLDALPCVPNPIISERVAPKYGDRAIGITDRVENDKQYRWGYSNPNGFADWFVDRQRVAFDRIAALRKQELVRHNPTVFASVADVPDQLVRTPLQRAIQILKRHRDVRFSGRPNEDDKPISIIITTLAALAYEQESDVLGALATFLDKIQRYQDTEIIRCVDGKWLIENPTNPGENFADRWNEESSQKADAFFEWLDWVREDLDDLLNAASESELTRFICRSFGQATGELVASTYRGPLPGAQRPAESLFSRVGRESLRFDVSHRQKPRWHLQPTRYSAVIRAKYKRNGFRPTVFQSNSSPLPKNIDLIFEVDTNVPKPYTVYWQVVNTGVEAARANLLRGDFYDSENTGCQRSESTKYQGMHWVEAFVVKDGVCVTRSGEFVVNIR